jgi:hypothetical protein
MRSHLKLTRKHRSPTSLKSLYEQLQHPKSDLHRIGKQLISIYKKFPDTIKYAISLFFTNGEIDMSIFEKVKEQTKYKIVYDYFDQGKTKDKAIKDHPFLFKSSLLLKGGYHPREREEALKIIDKLVEKGDIHADEFIIHGGKINKRLFLMIHPDKREDKKQATYEFDLVNGFLNFVLEQGIQELSARQAHEVGFQLRTRIHTYSYPTTTTRRRTPSPKMTYWRDISPIGEDYFIQKLARAVRDEDRYWVSVICLMLLLISLSGSLLVIGIVNPSSLDKI